MGACKSCLSSEAVNKESIKKGSMGSMRNSGGKRALRAADSLYVADIRKQKTKNMKLSNQLKILHFNDSYNIQNEGEDGKGGAGKFVNALNFYQDLCKNDGEYECLTLFSGDLLGPSLISTMFEGEQMVLPFNRMQVDVACVGNHDLDFGIEQMMKCLNQTMAPEGKCQWIMSNLVEKGQADGDVSFGGLARTATVERCGIKIGFIGIAEKDWTETFKDLEVEVEYLNYKRCAQQMAEKLRGDGCTIVIALSHMRIHHDLKFAEQVPGIDFVLGGHDHFYKFEAVEQKNDKSKIVPLVKSGTDFHEFSEINITFDISEVEYNEIAAEIVKADYYEPTNNKVYRKKDEDEDMGLLTYSDANQMMIHVNHIRMSDYDF